MARNYPFGKASLIFILALLLSLSFLGVSGHKRSALAQNGNGFTLEQWAYQSEYPLLQLKPGAFHVLFKAADAKKKSGPWIVTVCYNNDSKAWILIYVTVIDQSSGFEYPEEVLKWCLDYNSRKSGAKFALDEKHGDIDAQWEIPTEMATVEVIDRMVNDVANTADSYHDTLLDLLGSGSH